MSFLLRYRRYRIGKLHRFDEIPEREFFGYLFEIFCQRPPLEMRQKRRRFHRGHRLRASLARNALFLSQVHEKIIPCDIFSRF